jgi:hypothetical protein
MRLKRFCAAVFAFGVPALLIEPARAQGRTDVAQWDFDGSLDSTTGQNPLLPQGDADVHFETLDIAGGPAQVAHFTRGTYFKVFHGFPSNGGGVYVNQFTLVMDVMFPDRSPSGGWAALLQTNCCDQNEGDWFVSDTGGLGVEGNYGGSVQDGAWYRVALVVDLVAGTYTSYLDGVQVQENTSSAYPDLDLDGRFSLYTPTDPDPEDHFFIFAGQSLNAEGYVNSVQFRGVPLSASEIASLGGPSAEGIPLPSLTLERQLPTGIAAGAPFQVTLDLTTYADLTDLTIRERIPGYWTASDPSFPGQIVVDAGGRQTLVWDIPGTVADQSFNYILTSPNPYANVSFVGSEVKAGGEMFNIIGDTAIKTGTDGFVAEGLAVTVRQPTAGCGGNDAGAAAQAQDYLTDGDAIREGTIAPALGESVSPDFLGASPSPGTVGPTSLSWTRLSGPLFQLNACSDCMSYLAFYAENTTGKPLQVSVASSSDDGEQILIDGKEVWNHSIPRGNGRAQVQDRSPFFDLAPGKHLVMQKVFQGCGGFDSAIRFEDSDRNPLVGPVPGGPLAFSLDPSGYEPARSFVLREIPNTLDVGETGQVMIKLRVKDGLADGTIEENVPEGFTISEVSDGGQKTAQKITWTIAGALSSRDFSYRIAIPPLSPDAVFSGTATLGGRSGAIVGDQEFIRGVMNRLGFIKHWLVLGPLDTAGLWPGDPNNPSTDPNGPMGTPENGDLRLDYLSDGTTTEKTIRPFDGMRFLPAFKSDGISGAKSLGLRSLTRACAPETPTWEAFISRSGTFDNNAYFGEDVDAHATYAVCYLTNTTGGDLKTNIAINSDDDFIAYLNGVEAVAYEQLTPCSATACGRGYGDEDTVANLAPIVLPPGESFLLTRVHDGSGKSGHRLRFQDDQGHPLLPPALAVSLRSQKSPPQVLVHRVLASNGYRLPETPAVTLRVESQGTHSVAIRETLPAGWSAGEISSGGSQVGDQVRWTLAGISGSLDLTYKLQAGDCPLDGGWCGNGAAGSEYTVDGGATHSLRGDTSFRRDSQGTDDLGLWDVRDIGYLGGATQRAGDHGVDVTGKGGGVKSTRDEFRFISQPATGDFELSAKIECLQDLSGLGQGGLMVRDTFDTFSAHAFFQLTPVVPAGGGVGTLKGLFRRQTKATQTSSPIVISDKDVLALPIYLKLKRAGLKMSLQRSSNGIDYAEVGTKDLGTGTTQLNLGSDALVGLATSAGGGGSTRVDYREVSLPPSNPPFLPTPPEPPALTGATGGKNQVSLVWAAPATGPAPTGYQIHRGSAPAGPYTLLAEVSALPAAYQDTGLEPDTQYCYQLKSKKNTTLSAAFSNQLCARTEKATAGGPTFRRGDADSSGVIDLSDAVRLLGYLFLGGAMPECLDAADFDDNGDADISDAIANLSYQFLGSAAPPDPGPAVCGPDKNQEADQGKPELGCTVGCR